MNHPYDATTYELYDCTPSASQRSLLTAVLADDDAALHAWREWRSTNNIEDIESASFRLLPLIYLRLKTLDPDDPLLSRLKVVYRHTWFKNQVLNNQARQAVEALGNAGIDAMLLKGGALALDYYPDGGARFMHDIDLMVRPADFIHAMELLGSSEWQLSGTSVGKMRIARRWRFVHGCGFKRKDAELDLHAQLSRFVWQDDALLWDSCNRVAWGSSNIRTPAPTIALYHACVHGVRWSYATLTWIPDAMVILKSDNNAIDWDLLLQLAKQSRTVYQLRQALTYLAMEWHAPVPSRVLEALTEETTSWVEQQEFAALAMKPERSLPQLIKRLWLRSCRFSQGGRAAHKPIGISLLAWIAYLALYKLAPQA